MAQYEVMDESDVFEQACLQQRATVEEMYFKCKARLLEKMPPEELKVNVSNPEANRDAPQFSNLSNVKLPTITLPEFDEDYSKWLTFHDTFLSMIHSSSEISSVQKFHYLRAALQGEAATKISSTSISAQNYAIAWDTLYKHYSNKNPLISFRFISFIQLEEPVEQMSLILMELL